MAYLIDTDWVLDHLAAVPEATHLLDELAPDGIAISIITYMEAFQGVERSPQRDAALAKLEAFVAGVPVLPFSGPADRRDRPGIRPDPGHA